jgi:hypothetical protein
LAEWKDGRRRISSKDYHNIATEPEDSLLHDVSKTKNPYELLGFGVVSLFRSMRYFSIIYFVLAVITLLCGILNYHSNLANIPNLSLTQMLAVTNMNQSVPVCI